jgi:AhpD family alkylhydroperoxidase
MLDMPQKVKEFFKDFECYVGKMKEQTPEMHGGFMTLFQRIMKKGALTVKQKEYIAVGIAVATRCSPCINLHVKKCLDAGASREEILEAASVAVMMTGGPAYTHVIQVMKALEALGEE